MPAIRKPAHLRHGYCRTMVLLVAMLGGIGVIAACGQAQRVTEMRVHHHHVAAASETPSDLISSIESGFGQSDIVAVTLGDPPAEYKNQTSGPWMYVQLGSVSGADSILGQWEANMLAGAYVSQASSVSLTPVTGLFVMNSATCLSDRDSGSCDESGGPITDIPEGTKKPVPFDPTSAPASSIQAIIESGLESAGLQLTSISMDTVDGNPVPVVVAETDDPAAVVANAPTDAEIFGANPNEFEGTYFELEDSAGNPVLVQSFASRTGAGVGWIAPEFQTSGG